MNVCESIAQHRAGTGTHDPLSPLKTLWYSYNPNTKFSLASPMSAGVKPPS